MFRNYIYQRVVRCCKLIDRANSVDKWIKVILMSFTGKAFRLILFEIVCLNKNKVILFFIIKSFVFFFELLCASNKILTAQNRRETAQIVEFSR